MEYFALFDKICKVLRSRNGTVMIISNLKILSTRNVKISTTIFLLYNFTTSGKQYFYIIVYFTLVFSWIFYIAKFYKIINFKILHIFMHNFSFL